MKRTRNVAAGNRLGGCGFWAVAGVLFLLLSVAGEPLVSAADEAASQEATAATRGKSSPPGVCPPFQLRDEEGNVINPVAGENAHKPYSPKQTCGKCHDYDKITQGYHFMQGKGEEPTADQKAVLSGPALQVPVTEKERGAHGNGHDIVHVLHDAVCGLSSGRRVRRV